MSEDNTNPVPRLHEIADAKLAAEAKARADAEAAAGAERARIAELAAHPEHVVTRADAEAVVRSIGRTCRGAPRVAERTAALALLEEGRHDEAAAMDDAARRYPRGTPKAGQYVCGADDNDVICAGPFDGEIHEYTCTCGLARRYGAPFFPNLPPDQAEGRAG